MTNISINKKRQGYSEEEDQFIRDNCGKISAKEIAEKLKRSYSSLRKRCFILRTSSRLLNPPSKKGQRKNFTEEEEKKFQFILDNYGKIPTTEIAAITGKKKHAIEEYCRRHGVKLGKNDEGKSVNTKNHPTLLPLLQDTLEAFYWMGYLMSDGYMHEGLGQIVLVSAERDKEHMDAYADFVQAKPKIYFQRFGYVKGGSNAIRISVAESKTAPKIAEKFDWKDKKTYNPPSVEKLSETLKEEDFFLAFFVGFCDGDGSLNKDGSGITMEKHISWAPVLQFFLNKLREIGYCQEERKTSVSKRGYSVFGIRNGVPLKIKKFILDKKIPFLKRKWDRVDENKPVKNKKKYA